LGKKRSCWCGKGAAGSWLGRDNAGEKLRNRGTKERGERREKKAPRNTRKNLSGGNKKRGNEQGRGFGAISSGGEKGV